MKHNDKTSQSDTSARLDAFLSDFLNKDIAEPAESQASPHRYQHAARRSVR